MTDEDLENAKRWMGSLPRHEFDVLLTLIRRQEAVAIKAERARRDAQTAAWLRAPSNRARTAVSLADAIERGEHEQ